MSESNQTSNQQCACPCCAIYGPLPVIDGTCRTCGHQHPGRNCEEFKAVQDTFLRRVADAFQKTLEAK